MQVKSQGKGSARAGTSTLTLLSTPLNAFVLEALADAPRPLAGLRREVGSPPQTTMRGHLRALGEIGVVTKQRQDEFPGAVNFELTACGRRLLVVTKILRAWLAAAPEGPLSIGSGAAKSAVKAVVEGWNTGMVRALAARPLSLTELDGLIAGVSYPSLERRLAAMRLAGQLEPKPGRGRGTPYAVTEWLRQAVAPLGAAARWERFNPAANATPVTRLDAEAGLLLAVPLLSLPPELSGFCRLAVETHNGDGQRLGGVLVGVSEGRVVSCVSRLQGHADAWVSGATSSWLRSVIKRETEGLEMGGDCRLATALVDGLHDALFGLAQEKPGSSVALSSPLFYLFSSLTVL